MRKLTGADINNLIGTTNAGYTIERARVKGGKYSDSDHYGIVLARSENEKLFVTWQFHLDNEMPSYYWGHFIADADKAIADYESRE